MSSVSHFGSVYVLLQPPLLVTPAPQLPRAPLSSLRSPVHLPLELDAHLPLQFAVDLHFVHSPSHAPPQSARPPPAVFSPSPLPSQLTSHPPVMVPSHSPVH